MESMENFVVETERLRILPLDEASFSLLLAGTGIYERTCGLEPTGEVWDPETRMAMEELYGRLLADPENRVFLTLWQIVDRSENRSVGSLCFHGPPDQAGRVEIGYGIYESERGKGYMTEAVRAVCDRILREERVCSVIALCERGNRASIGVLLRCGFTPENADEEMIGWIKRI